MADQACYTITIGPGTLTQTIGGDHNCVVRSLVGDTTGNSTVNLSDGILTSMKASASVTASAAPEHDVNLSGGTMTLRMSSLLSRWSLRPRTRRCVPEQWKSGLWK